MGVMDFLKGMFSSKPEDQSVNNMSEPGSAEPMSEEPKIEESGEDMGSSDDLSSQE